MGVGFVGAQKDCTLVGEEAHVLLVKVGDGEERVLRERLRLRCIVGFRRTSFCDVLEEMEQLILAWINATGRMQGEML